jgi:hypothetical protein
MNEPIGRPVHLADELALYGAKIHGIRNDVKVVVQAEGCGVNGSAEVARTRHFHQSVNSVQAGKHPTGMAVLVGRMLRDEGGRGRRCPTLDVVAVVRSNAFGNVE